MSYFKNAFQNVNVIRNNTQVYGEYRGYHMCVDYDKKAKELVAYVKYTRGEAGVKERLKKSLDSEISRQNQPFAVHVGEHVVQMKVQQAPKGKLCEYGEWAVNTMIMALMMEDCVAGCEICEKEGALRDYNFDGKVSTLCEDCAIRVSKSYLTGAKKIKPEESNMGLGIIGAFLGAMIGGAVWIAIFQTGIMVSILGALMSWLALVGYEKMGKSLDEKGISAVLIVSLIVVFLSNCLGWSIYIQNEYRDIGVHLSLMEIALELFEIISDAGMMKSFAKGLTKCCMFAVLAIVPKWKENAGI